MKDELKTKKVRAKDDDHGHTKKAEEKPIIPIKLPLHDRLVQL